MTELQLPVLVTELFTAFGITDPAQMLILLLSTILCVLLVLIFLIAMRGRPSPHKEGKVEISSTAASPYIEPTISVDHQLTNEDESVTEKAAHSDTAIRGAERVEDFQIFKRPRQKSHHANQPAPSLETGEKMTTNDNLRLIEKEMVRLRDLYQKGHITRDMYIDETRSLYHQARGLSSFP